MKGSKNQTVNEICEGIRGNVADLWEGRISYGEFSARARRLWAEVPESFLDEVAEKLNPRGIGVSAILEERKTKETER